MRDEGKFLVSLVSLVLVVTLMGCTLQNEGVTTTAFHHPEGELPPPAQYVYNYYPALNVYYDVDRQLYFYREAGRWKASTTLPEEITLKTAEGDPADYVTVETNSAIPDTESGRRARRAPQAKEGQK